MTDVVTPAVIAPTGAVPDVAPSTLISTDWGNSVGSSSKGRAVQRFNSTAERDGSITAPVAGMLCYVLANDTLYLYAKAGAWVSLSARDVLHARVYRAAAFTVGTAYAPVAYDTVDRDPTGMWSTPNSRFTVPTTGVYQIYARVNLTSGTWLFVAIYRTGTLVSESASAATKAGTVFTQNTAVLYCAAGDTLQIQAGADVAATGSPTKAQTFTTLDYLGTG